MLNEVSKILDVFEAIRLEKKPILKMKVIDDAIVDKSISGDLVLLLSIYYHGLLQCPKPKWKNSSTYSKGQCKTVLLQMLTGDSIDTKEFHELPLKIQLVLYYSSKCSDIGLNNSQLMSKIEVLNKYNIVELLGITDAIRDEIPYTVSIVCPKCGAKSDTDKVCHTCMEDIILATEYNIESFEVYGTSLKDFNARFMDWHLEVTNGLFKFTKLTESIQQYEPQLPFEEYRKTLQLI
jgi:hypothetical protein